MTACGVVRRQMSCTDLTGDGSDGEGVCGDQASFQDSGIITTEITKEEWPWTWSSPGCTTFQGHLFSHPVLGFFSEEVSKPRSPRQRPTTSSPRCSRARLPSPAAGREETSTWLQPQEPPLPPTMVPEGQCTGFRDQLQNSTLMPVEAD